MGTVRILCGASTISLQAAVHPKYTLGALNMKEEEEGTVLTLCGLNFVYLITESHKYTLCVSVHRHFSDKHQVVRIASTLFSGMVVSDLGWQEVVKAYLKLLSRCLYRRTEEDREIAALKAYSLLVFKATPY